MVRIGRGDESALRALIEKHQGAVYGTIAKMLGDPVEAQDLHSRFSCGFIAAGTYRATAQFKTWIFTLCAISSLTKHRRRSRATLIFATSGGERAGEFGECLELRSARPRRQDAGGKSVAAEMLGKIDEAILACRISSGWHCFAPLR